MDGLAVEAVGGERRQLQERRSGIEEHGDPLARQQLPRARCRSRDRGGPPSAAAARRARSSAARIAHDDTGSSGEALGSTCSALMIVMVGPALFAPESWLGRDGSVKRRGAPLRARKGARHYRFGNRRKDLSATSRRNLLFVASQNGEVGMILLRKILKPAIGAVGGAIAIALIGLGPGIRPRAILRELQRRRRRQGDGCGGRRDPVLAGNPVGAKPDVCPSGSYYRPRDARRRGAAPPVRLRHR